MFKKIAILLAIVVFFAIPPATGFAAQKTVTPTKKIVKQVSKKLAPKKTTKKPAPKKKVLGANTLLSLFRPGLIDCRMPDGKTIKATKKDCDAVNNFWGSVKHSNPPASGGGSNSGGGSSNNNPTPTPVVTTVTNAELMACGSSSCGIIKTVRVSGTNFNSGSRVELTNNGNTYGENTSLNYVPDAMLTGGNGSTEIIMDFFNLAPCTTYGVQVNQNSQIIVSPVSISTACI